MGYTIPIPKKNVTAALCAADSAMQNKEYTEAHQIILELYAEIQEFDKK